MVERSYCSECRAESPELTAVGSHLLCAGCVSEGGDCAEAQGLPTDVPLHEQIEFIRMLCNGVFYGNQIRVGGAVLRTLIEAARST